MAMGTNVTEMKLKDQNNQKQVGNNKIIVKKPYMKPLLTPLGDIRDVTMGGSPGFGDSGGGNPEKPF